MDKNFWDWFNKISKPRTIKKDYSNYENTELCKKCGGECCKTCGCHYSPDDFKDLTFKGLKKELKKGYISIDCIDGEMFWMEGFYYILRTRNVGMPIVDMGYKRAPCILLTDNGCKLNYNERPSGGKLLIPEVHKKCYSNYGIKECCIEWTPYQHVLGELADYFKKKNFPCSI